MKSPRGASFWAALPDGVTALYFLSVWCSPFLVSSLGVKTALLTMLLEFFLVQIAGFFTALSNMDDVKKHVRVLGLLGLSLFYLLMVTAFAVSFHEAWPFLAFGWLVVGKAAWLITRPATTDDQMMGLMAAWAGSVGAYLAAVFATSIPESFPRWGILAELQPRFDLGEPGGGLWVDEPHRVVAAGVIYFSLLFFGKLLAAAFAARRKR